jgi:putative ABC transport system permease protein
LFASSASDLVASGLEAAGAGMLTTGLALYVSGHRSLGREVSEERAELVVTRAPAWRRFGLDVALLAVAGIAEVVAFRAGAFDAPMGSVSTGQSVSLPTHLLLAPLVAWIGGTLLAVRVFEALAARSPTAAPPRFGSIIGGTLGRSLRLRSWQFGAGVLSVGLVTAFGMSLATFAASYDDAKATDSRFTVGSDLRLTPSPLDPHPVRPSLASRLKVPGVTAATPVAARLENAVLIGPHNQDLKDLTAIDPAGFQRVAPLSDSFFVDRTAASAMSALANDPRALLVDAQTAGDLQVHAGDSVRVLLARGTKHQALRTFRVAGLFERFPGFPQGTNLVANLGYYEAATGLRHADFFLARTSDESSAGLARAIATLRAGPARSGAVNIESTQTTLNKDQSSLTALNVHGLVDLDSLFTLLMALTAIAIFVFGLMLQRRREYVTLRAQGMQARELRTLVLGEVTLVAGCGLAAGLLVGTGMAALLVHVLRPLFILDPGVTFPAAELARLAILMVFATLAATLSASAVLRRLRPVELLREQ